MRRRHKSKNSESKAGGAYTDDEGFGSCTEPTTNGGGPESMNLSLNGGAPNTAVTNCTTPVTPTAGQYTLPSLFDKISHIVIFLCW